MPWEWADDEGDGDQADDDNQENEGNGLDSGSEDHSKGPTQKKFHPHLNGEHHKMHHYTPAGYLINLAGRICNEHGVYIPKDSSPPPREDGDSNDWETFDNRNQFETADFLFRKNQMSGGDIDTLMKLWADSGATPPFRNHDDLYGRIDASAVGEAPWDHFTVVYDGLIPNGPNDPEPPEWMTQEFQAWFRDPVQLIRNLVANPDFKDEFDYTPYQEYDEHGEHRFQDLMSGDWVWRQVVCFILPAAKPYTDYTSRISSPRILACTGPSLSL